VTKLFHIKCDHAACVSADGGHFSVRLWSRLIWRNFVKVADNWIRICNLAYIGTYNKHVKFGLKIPNRLGKNVRISRGIFWLTLYIEQTFLFAFAENHVGTLLTVLTAVNYCWCCCSMGESASWMADWKKILPWRAGPCSKRYAAR